MPSVTINIRKDKKVKEEGETIFKDMGLSTSSAINVFLRQTIRDKQIPFIISHNNLVAKLVKRSKRLMTSQKIQIKKLTVCLKNSENSWMFNVKVF